MRIGLLPLDERPVNVRYPQMIAQIAGGSVILPPADVLSNRRQAARTDELVQWLEAQAATLDVLIVSVEMLGYGGLIASRTTDDSTLEVLQRLNVLRELRQQYPCLTIFAFNVITRISNANNNVEEPLYWDVYGVRLYRYSQYMHRYAGNLAEPPLTDLIAELPSEHITDFTRRRLRNHQVNLAMMEMMADGVLDLLVLSSDDTSAYGFGSEEKRWLQVWEKRLRHRAANLLMYPGADEIGCVLMMRALLADAAPSRIYAHYAIPEDKEITAPYEDGPVHVTITRQIRAIGGVKVGSVGEADIILAVNPPTRTGEEFNPHTKIFAPEHERRLPHIKQFVADVESWLQTGIPVILADVAYPNGSDPDLIQQMFASSDLMPTALAGYGSWNTAGNTIGTALAQGIATLHMTKPAELSAQQRFLLHRFVEDWGYQHLVRQQTRDWLESTTGERDPQPDQLKQTKQMIEQMLAEPFDSLAAFWPDWRIVPSSIRLPWKRTFEVDFDLEQQS